MSRYKFRAWDKNEKWMVYDVQNAYDGMWSERNSDEINDHYAYVSSFKSFMDEEEFNFMQYTGLKDRNGVEIYEGDILYFEPYETHGNDRIVEYIDGAYRGRLIRNGYSKLLSECVYETKVIGNIYQNPELFGA